VGREENRATRTTLFAGIAGVGLVFAGCRPEAGEKPIEHRIEACTKMCQVMTDPECGIPRDVAEVRIGDVDGCVQNCAVTSTDLGWYWGYDQETKTDQCIDELHRRTDCMLALSCEDQSLMHGDQVCGPGLEDQCPCWPETRALLDCNRAVYGTANGGEK
jgi:hypothetical protein